jgi:dolichol-phosphate mannosyltransferase
MSRELVSVVVPVYYNADSLGRLAERLGLVAAGADWDMEVVFVDDGSGDASWARIQEIARSLPRARGVRLTRNFGSQMAITAGLAEARGQAAAVLSADLQEPPELLPEMVAAWRKGATAVLAVRRSRPEGLATRAAAGFYYRTLRRLAFSDMPSGGFDCFLIARPAIDFLVESREVHTSLPGLLLWGGFATALVPYDRTARQEGGSRWTFGKKLKYFLDAVISFSYAPLRWMSAAGDRGLRVRRLSRRLQDRRGPADPRLDVADGRPRVLLGRAASLARHPRRIPLAHARCREGSKRVSRARTNGLRPKGGRSMTTHGIRLGISAALLCAAAAVGTGQTAEAPDTFGDTTDAITLIPARSFLPLDSADGWTGNEAEVQSPGRLTASLNMLPNGAVITQIVVYVRDNDLAEDVSVNICTRSYESGNGNPSGLSCLGAESAGAPGDTFVIFNSERDIQYREATPSPVLHDYYLVVQTPGDTAVRLARVRWHRRVSPAGSATFNDVPSDHPFFQFIEALSASGITAGCNAAPPLYCPEAPLTRGQMATFLAKALGLHWPWDAP